MDDLERQFSPNKLPPLNLTKVRDKALDFIYNQQLEYLSASSNSDGSPVFIQDNDKYSPPRQKTPEKLQTRGKS